MSHWMKRSLAALGACALLLTGCNDAQQETDKNTDSEPVEITENDVYLVPDDPTAYMKTAYDEVSSALNEADEEKEAEAVAKLFIADFFTLSNKTADTDVGGLEYLKTEVTLRLARMDDYDHDTREEMESGELEEIPEAKNLFRVISLS